MYFLYSALLAAGLLLSLPYWLVQMLRHGKYGAALRERLGRPPARLYSLNRPVIWVHAVSVGEVLAVSTLVAELKAHFLEYSVVISTTTNTGQKLASSRFGADSVFYFPLDFQFAIRPYLDILNPKLIVIAETEFWPNFLRMAHNSGSRVAIVNARISDRSLRGYRRFRFLLRRILRSVDVFLAQTEEAARRLADLGVKADKIQVTGNLKFDVPTPPIPAIVASLQASFQVSGSGPVIVAGSTMDGEETLLLRAFENVLASHKRAVLLLAPRHPERFATVAALLEQLRIRFWRRSLWGGEPLGGSVLLVDTIGELAALYSLADIAFVGGSLVPRGGHNIIEPAQHGVAILVGNHTENFRDVVGLFQSRDALRVVGPAELPLVLIELIENDNERRALGRRAGETFQSQSGAAQRTIEALEKLIPLSGEHQGVGRQ
jgi:3-deoxy-D-manno-octulosonic-acid transferase